MGSLLEFLRTREGAENSLADSGELAFGLWALGQLSPQGSECEGCCCPLVAKRAYSCLFHAAALRELLDK